MKKDNDDKPLLTPLQAILASLAACALIWAYAIVGMIENL